ncbi:MAG: hypothetical protein R2911_16295 [Caldilineaceae bacterium]
MPKIRIGFIGAGWWATTNHMPLLAQRADVELAGVCSFARCCTPCSRSLAFPWPPRIIVNCCN